MLHCLGSYWACSVVRKGDPHRLIAGVSCGAPCESSPSCLAWYVGRMVCLQQYYVSTVAWYRTYSTCINQPACPTPQVALQNGLAWVGEALGALPEEAATAADRQRFLTACQQVVAEGIAVNDEKVLQVRAGLGGSE